MIRYLPHLIDLSHNAVVCQIGQVSFGILNVFQKVLEGVDKAFIGWASRKL